MLLVLAGMCLVTYLPRVLPVFILSRRRLPELLVRWLSFVPVAVLAALLGPALLTPSGRFDLHFSSNPALWISVPVFVVAVKTRNLFVTVLSGLLLMALCRLLMAC